MLTATASGSRRRCPGARSSASATPTAIERGASSTSFSARDPVAAAVPTMSTTSARSSRRKRPGANAPRPGSSVMRVLPAAAFVALGYRHLHRPAGLKLRVDGGAVRDRHLGGIPGAAAARQHLSHGLAGGGRSNTQTALDEPLAVFGAKCAERSGRLLERRAVASPVASAGQARHAEHVLAVGDPREPHPLPRARVGHEDGGRQRRNSRALDLLELRILEAVLAGCGHRIVALAGVAQDDGGVTVGRDRAGGLRGVDRFPLRRHLESQIEAGVDEERAKEYTGRRVVTDHDALELLEKRTAARPNGVAVARVWARAAARTFSTRSGVAGCVAKKPGRLGSWPASASSRSSVWRNDARPSGFQPAPAARTMPCLSASRSWSRLYDARTMPDASSPVPS